MNSIFTYYLRLTITIIKKQCLICTSTSKVLKASHLFGTELLNRILRIKSTLQVTLIGANGRQQKFVETW